MPVLELEELVGLVVAPLVDLVALVLEPVSLRLPVHYLLLQLHLVQILVGRLLQLPVVRVDVVHLPLEPVEEVLPVHVDRAAHLPHQRVNAVVHLPKGLVNFVLGHHLVVELLLRPHLILLHVNQIAL